MVIFDPQKKSFDPFKYLKESHVAKSYWSSSKRRKYSSYKVLASTFNCTENIFLTLRSIKNWFSSRDKLHLYPWMNKKGYLCNLKILRFRILGIHFSNNALFQINFIASPSEFCTWAVCYQSSHKTKHDGSTYCWPRFTRAFNFLQKILEQTVGITVGYFSAVSYLLNKKGP